MEAWAWHLLYRSKLLDMCHRLPVIQFARVDSISESSRKQSEQLTIMQESLLERVKKNCNWS